MYQPQPIDTSSVQLPPSLSPLIEKLAEHNHDIWAKGRILAITALSYMHPIHSFSNKADGLG